MTSYTLIAYRPNSSVSACDLGCCGRNTFDSEHSVTRSLDKQALADKIAEFKFQDDTYEGAEKWQLTYLPEGPLGENWDDPELEDFIHYRTVALKNEAAAFELKQAEEARVKAERVQEEHEKAELARLQAKYVGSPGI